MKRSLLPVDIAVVTWVRNSATLGVRNFGKFVGYSRSGNRFTYLLLQVRGLLPMLSARRVLLVVG